MRSAKDFFAPLAVGAPAPVREIPARPSRAIHFFDPSNEKMAAKIPAMVGTVDVLLGNLEDAVKADNKVAAREGLVKIAEGTDFGPTQLWTRINSLDSPWVLDDLTTLVPAIGDKLDVIMVPKVQGAEDIHYVDRLLAQLEAKAGLDRPIRTSPSRAAVLLSALTASSRLPRRTSTVPTMPGTFAVIFSFDGSKKWMARLGRAGISRRGSGAPTASGRKKSLALRMPGR